MTRPANLPDLPELESVECGVVASGRSRVGALIGFLAIPLALSAMVFVVCALSWRSLVLYGGATIAVIGMTAVGLLDLWCVWRILWGDCSWKTDPEGITATAAVRRRFLPWSQVTDVRLGRSPAGYDRCELRSDRVRVVIAGAVDTPILVASIRQHLRRAGRDFDLSVPDEAMSLWDRIPDEVPREMSWANPKPPAYAAVCWTLCALMVAGAAVALFMPSPDRFRTVALLLAAEMIAVFVVVLANVRRVAVSIELDQDGLRARFPRGDASLLWCDVTSASPGISRLVIRFGPGRDAVVIQADRTDESTGKLVLAIVRRLRETGHVGAVTIPESFRRQTPARAEPGPPAPGVPGPVELRMTRAEVLIISATFLVVGAVGLLSVLDPRNQPREYAGVYAGAFCVLFALAWLALAGTYRARADGEGITRSCFGWKRAVRWEQVARYVVTPRAQSRHGHQRLLLDSDGKTLMDISLAVGTPADRKRFLDFVHAQLARVLPDGGNQSWHAVPASSLNSPAISSSGSEK